MVYKCVLYQQNCMYDSCNYEKSEDSVCAALSAYARACAAEGVTLVGWRGDLCGMYEGFYMADIIQDICIIL